MMLAPILLVFLAIAGLFNRLDAGHAKKFNHAHKKWIEANFK